DKIDESKIPSPILNTNFIEFLKLENIAHSSDGLKRVHRSHGHTVEDMIKLRLGTCESRIPDLVVWPTCHEDVIKIVRAANEFDVVIIPIGGFTLGHEPDSIEFSSLGGWVATRASGIKKNKYGNIEDILIHVTFVTSKGVIQKSCMAPRISSGPDIHHMIIGSEGTLGVVTEVTFKICPLPQCKKFGSVLFPTFEKGVEALREIAKEKIAPASIRLMDNEQFKFGQALKTSSSFFTSINDFLKRLYVMQWKRFDANKMAPATIVFEGNKEEVEMQEKRVYSICGKYDGFPAGEENGRYGYQLTFSIAYLRNSKNCASPSFSGFLIFNFFVQDVGMNYMAIGESFETSVPWDWLDGITTIDNVIRLCNNVKELCRRECSRLGVRHPPLISCRSGWDMILTQLYDAGACIYFYFGFNYRDLQHNENDDDRSLLEKALHVYEQIERGCQVETEVPKYTTNFGKP
uniref:Alkylglycerone-phosphate synthase n=1 Tax=Romanomermis culicivorax TaxID=13658 RepID=A0A915HUR8_ROMCU